MRNGEHEPGVGPTREIYAAQLRGLRTARESESEAMTPDSAPGSRTAHFQAGASEPADQYAQVHASNDTRGAHAEHIDSLGDGELYG
jgi:hypothetical protein